MNKRCATCKKEGDNLGPAEFEAGNNAEIGVEIDICEECDEDYSENYNAFQSKYCDIIERAASEKLVDAMDYYADR